MLFEGDSGVSKMKDEISVAEYRRKRVEKHLRKQHEIADTIDGDIKFGIDSIKELFANFREMVVNVNASFYKNLLEEGLNQFADARKSTGIYEFKLGNSEDEKAILQHNQMKNYFRIVVKDRKDAPKRWYFY